MHTVCGTSTENTLIDLLCSLASNLKLQLDLVHSSIENLTKALLQKSQNTLKLDYIKGSLDIVIETQKRLEVQLNQYSLQFIQRHPIEKENQKLLTSLQRDLLQFQLVIEKFETKLETIHRKVSE